MLVQRGFDFRHQRVQQTIGVGQRFMRQYTTLDGKHNPVQGHARHKTLLAFLVGGAHGGNIARHIGFTRVQHAGQLAEHLAARGIEHVRGEQRGRDVQALAVRNAQVLLQHALQFGQTRKEPAVTGMVGAVQQRNRPQLIRHKRAIRTGDVRLGNQRAGGVDQSLTCGRRIVQGK